MVELFEHKGKQPSIHSSKGNQLKWMKDDIWYKADYTGYEGLSEYLIAGLLKFSDLSSDEYVKYDTECIMYEDVIYRGCGSSNFLPRGWMLITLERLYKNVKGESLNRAIYSIEKKEERIRFLVEEMIRITGLQDFGSYMSKVLTLDAFFLNEDRHTHNIAVLLDEKGMYHYCPLFDHGASLLSDTTMDYPLHSDTDNMLSKVRAKTFCPDFDEQLDIVEKLYGKHLHFSFRRKDVERILEQESIYSQEEKQRVLNLVMRQREKYQYLF